MHEHDTMQLEHLLLQVLDAPDEQRDVALEAACRESPDLAPRLRQRLDELSRFGLVAAGPAPIPTTPDRIGAYRVLQVLGRGGMGLVYLAEHEQLHRRVAVKCIRPEFLDSSRARERFARETPAIARLEHPGLCTVYETGEWQGQPFLAMHFVAGEPLDQQLRRARATGQTAWSRSSSGDRQDPSFGSDSGARSRAVRDATALVQALAEAVHVMHEAGLVHRDIKPANVMLSRRPPGAARLRPGPRPARRRAGADAQRRRVGTPAYMAPEQVAARRASTAAPTCTRSARCCTSA